MINDFTLLGIEETDDLSIIKKAYHKRVKQLHPDTAEDMDLIRNHLLFAEVCKAYQRLSAGKEKQSVRQKEKTTETGKPVSGKPVSGKGITPHADPAYVYYKQGSAYFSKIHPSQWNIPSKKAEFATIGEADEEEQKEIQTRVIQLVSLFPKAYYYFSIVVSDYPDSLWVTDARDKMKLIEVRMKRYKSIIESFTKWNAFAQVKKENHDKIRNQAQEINKTANDGIRVKWM